MNRLLTMAFCGCLLLAEAAGQTSHFNFDNRDDADRTSKRNCYVEMKHYRGPNRPPRIVKRGFGYPSPNHGRYRHLSRVPAGEFKDCRVFDDDLLAVAMRFHWTNRQGRSLKSEWVEAEPGNYLQYVFLKWVEDDEDHSNDAAYEIDQISEASLPRGARSTDPGDTDRELVRTYFAYDYDDEVGPVRVYLSGPHGSTWFPLGPDDHPGLWHVDDGLERALAVFRVDTGELVTLLHYVPGSFTLLLDEGLCEDAEQAAAPEAEAEDSDPAQPAGAY